MLKAAILFKDELTNIQYHAWYDEKYMYWSGSYYNTITLDTNNYNRNQFVSIDADKKILGYIGYSINRQSNRAYDLSIINFSDNHIQFGKDVQRCIDEIFTKYNFDKLNFDVFIGNPIEKTYDKLIKKYGGFIVGTKKNHCKIMTGELCDNKLYELHKTDYLKNRKIK